ncbi:hypothetical protein QTO34_006409 [Cnephaeus nilssonii]|uniref:Uncharacterized protein n=1 Tax=Cnephaeus nilssonii TaxID=3371016 RepID=A0AA40LIF4_CNENI|nr:hypothetical protein QTO34_006409 [Eptesicus nilssonii]
MRPYLEEFSRLQRELPSFSLSRFSTKKDVNPILRRGDLMEGELYSALKEEEASESVSSTNFSGEMHFYELVEDTKDGIWLVQVPETVIEVNLFLPK